MFKKSWKLADLWRFHSRFPSFPSSWRTICQWCKSRRTSSANPRREGWKRINNHRCCTIFILSESFTISIEFSLSGGWKGAPLDRIADRRERSSSSILSPPLPRYSCWKSSALQVTTWNTSFWSCLTWRSTDVWWRIEERRVRHKFSSERESWNAVGRKSTWESRWEAQGSIGRWKEWCSVSQCSWWYCHWDTTSRLQRETRSWCVCLRSKLCPKKFASFPNKLDWKQEYSLTWNQILSCETCKNFRFLDSLWRSSDSISDSN